MQSRTRRCYQFSLRTMFVLVFVVSIPLAWVGYSLNWIRQRHDALKSDVTWSRWGAGDYEISRWESPGLLGLFGERGKGLVLCRRDSPPAVVERVKRLFPEAWVMPEGEEFEDEP